MTAVPEPVDIPNDTTEHFIRQSGRRLLIGGIVGALGTSIVASTNQNPSQILLGWLIVSFTASAIAACIGLLERTQRHPRAADRQIIANQKALIERQQTILDHIALIHDTFADLAATLPDDLDKRWWKGFNSAALKGLVDTGTEGARPRRPRHLTEVVSMPASRTPPA